MTKARETKFDSDSIFMIDDKANVSERQAKESLLKSAVRYLKMYLDPNVTQTQFKNFFNDSFKIDGIKMKNRRDGVYATNQQIQDLPLIIKHSKG